MLYEIFAIKDTKVGFMNPTVEANQNVAIRNFSYAMNVKDSLFTFRPSDFEFYKLGTFDTDIGSVTPCIEFICTGDSVIEKKGKR